MTVNCFPAEPHDNANKYDWDIECGQENLISSLSWTSKPIVFKMITKQTMIWGSLLVILMFAGTVFYLWVCNFVQDPLTEIAKNCVIYYHARAAMDIALYPFTNSPIIQPIVKSIQNYNTIVDNLDPCVNWRFTFFLS